MTKFKAERLRRLLEQKHAEFIDSRQIERDAITPALAYQRAVDREFAAFICSVLAYGKVAHIQSSTRKVLAPLGDQPVARLLEWERADIRRVLKGWVHRFNTARDMEYLLVALRSLYLEHGTLERALMARMQVSVHGGDVGSWSAQDYVENLVELVEESLPGRPARSFWFFLPRPSSGGACKRMNLYLRWMVGVSEMDLSLWKSIPRSRLIIPLDTHIHRQALLLGLTARKANDWKTAVEVTESLKLLDPEDPTRFDFALCHVGITGQVVR